MSPEGKKKFTYADYVVLEDNVIYEVINGKIISMSPSPTTKLQDVIDELSAEFKIFLLRWMFACLQIAKQPMQIFRIGYSLI